MKIPNFFTLFLPAILAIICATNANARSSFWSSPPDGSTACAACHGATTTCAGCHAHGTHPDSNKNTINVSATTDKAIYAPGETVTVSITGSYRPGWVRAKLWNQDCNVIGCLSSGAVAVASNTCPSCPVGVGGDDGVTSEFPGPVLLTFPAPANPGLVTWSAYWYGNNFDLGRIGGSTTFGPLWLMDPGNPDHGDEIVTFSFEVQGGGNIPPVAVDDLPAGTPIVSTPVNTSVDIDVLANDTDDDVEDTLTVNSFDAASSNGGSVSCSLSTTTPTPQCSFTPAANVCGIDSFTYDATDGTDTSNRATVTIRVGDANAPIVSPPADLSITLPPGSSGPVPATDPTIATWLASATAIDAEDGNVSVSNNAPADFPIGTTPVTFMATDSCGNTGMASANVIILVADNNTPVVTAPDPLTLTAPLCAASLPQSDTQITAWLNMATATDVEDGPLAVSNDAPLDFLVGETLVIFSATDSLGATGTAVSTLTVNETPNSAPVVNAPTGIIITVPTGTTSLPASNPEIATFLAAATADDAEDGPLPVSNDAPTDFLLGVTTVTFTATDSCGLTTTATSTVTIQEEVTVIVDLDIAQFQVTKGIRLARVKAVQIKLVVKNNGAFEGNAPATVIGVQNGVEVYNQTMTVSDPTGNGRTKFIFPGFTPSLAGDITWTATIADGDPDDDTAMATTSVQ